MRVDDSIGSLVSALLGASLIWLLGRGVMGCLSSVVLGAIVWQGYLRLLRPRLLARAEARAERERAAPDYRLTRHRQP